MSNRGTFMIGEMAQKSGVSIRTLRYYDNIELLTPSAFTEGGHRLYSSEDLSTLQNIKSLQFLGFSLKDIKNMLQENTAKGSEMLKSLNEKRQKLEAKKFEIMNMLSDLDYIIETIEGEETVNINMICLMLQKLMFEEDTKNWFEDHFSRDITDELFPMNKVDEIELDKKWIKILTEIKYLTLNKATPSSNESQFTISSLIKLMNETTQGNLDIVIERLPTTASFSFPNPFTNEEEEFLKEAMKFYRKNNTGY